MLKMVNKEKKFVNWALRIYFNGLEPKYKEIFDIEKLSGVSLSSAFIDSPIQKFSL